MKRVDICWVPYLLSGDIFEFHRVGFVPGSAAIFAECSVYVSISFFVLSRGSPIKGVSLGISRESRRHGCWRDDAVFERAVFRTRSSFSFFFS